MGQGVEGYVLGAVVLVLFVERFGVALGVVELVGLVLVFGEGEVGF